MSPNFFIFSFLFVLLLLSFLSLGVIQLGCQFNKGDENETQQEWVQVLSG
jgi:hypothetical protein